MESVASAEVLKPVSGELCHTLKLIKDEGIAATQADLLTVIERRKLAAAAFLT